MQVRENDDKISGFGATRFSIPEWRTKKRQQQQQQQQQQQGKQKKKEETRRNKQKAREGKHKDIRQEKEHKIREKTPQESASEEMCFSRTSPRMAEVWGG